MGLLGYPIFLLKSYEDEVSQSLKSLKQLRMVTSRSYCGRHFVHLNFQKTY